MTRLEELRHWLAVLEELRPFVDPSDASRAAFNAAWAKAYEQAMAAAEGWSAQPKSAGLDLSGPE